MTPDPAAASPTAALWRRSGVAAGVLVVALGVFTVATVVTRDRREQVAHAAATLTALQDERAILLATYLAERGGDAYVLGQRTDLAQIQDTDPDLPVSPALTQALETRIAAHGYRTADIIDRAGRVRAHAGAATDPALLAYAAHAAVTDFVRGTDGTWWLAAVAPSASGTVLLSADPTTTLWPLLRQGGPTVPNLHTLLFRREGGELVALWPSPGGISGHVPPDTSDLVALARRAQTTGRAVETSVAADGAEWLTAARWLPQTREVLVDAVPYDEALRGGRHRTWSDIGLAVGAVLIIAMLTAFAAASRTRARVLEAVAHDRSAALREHRFQRLVENGSDLISILGPDSTILYQSPSSLAVLGYAPEEMLGQRSADWVHPDDRERALAVLGEVAAEPGSGARAQLRLRHRDGSWRDVAIVGRNALAEPGIEGIVMSGRDITEQVAAQRALEHANVELERRVGAATDELRAANQALAEVAQTKDEFLASVSHELRTPLHAVLGITEAMQESVYGALNDRQLQAVQTIEASGRDLLSLINDVLEVAKIEAGRLELDCQPFAVDALCQSSLRLVREAAAKKHLRVELRLDPEAPQLIADARRLKQVLVNLLSNAVKFTPDGGRIELATAADRDAQRLTISVSDSGIGIAAADLPKLFQPFRQIDARLSRDYTGTGLGLALVRRLVELHGGSVAVESREGAGSRFLVSLPWDATVAAPAPAPAEPGRAAPVALLADDSGASLAALAATLRGAGYRVETAREGADAVAAARARRPALVVLGARLAGLDTLDVARRLRDDPGLETVPIVVLAALVLPGDRERARAAGVDLYLAKPVPTPVLLDHLAALVHDKAA